MPKRSFDMDAPPTAVRVLVANPKRLSYSLVNNGSAAIYTGADQGLTVDSGEPLTPGAMVSDDSDKEDVWAISSSGTQDIRVTEILEA